MADGDVILYTTDDGESQVALRVLGGSVWLTQVEIAALFQTTVSNINKHIKGILDDIELTEATIEYYSIVQIEGGREVSRQVAHYSLPMILAIGYRVRSPRGVQFRQWATKVLAEYLVKGFAMDDARLKEPAWDYFDELLERIRDIRASEKRFYQKVRDVFAQTSVDYDRASDTAAIFFQTIQNKMLFAVTGQTAAELIVARADGGAPNMGLTAWKGARVRKEDVTVSKNYLNEPEVQELNRLTTMFLDFAEDRAARHQQTTMAEWVAQTDRFLAFNERDVLANAGSVSHKRMEEIAHDRYAAFDTRRRAAERLAADREDDEQTIKDIEQLQKKLAGKKKKGS